MKYHLRLPEGLFRRVQNDLRRAHPVAYERVGFLFARSDASRTLFLGHAYEPVAEEDYLPDDDVGAKIGSRAIRAALQRTLSSGDSVFHVHLHNHPGQTGMSWVDAGSLRELLPSFYSATPEMRHGALILSQDEATAWLWNKETRNFDPVARISIVGFPLQNFFFEEVQ